jgi:hypothetical protein
MTDMLCFTCIKANVCIHYANLMNANDFAVTITSIECRFYEPEEVTS